MVAHTAVLLAVVAVCCARAMTGTDRSALSLVTQKMTWKRSVVNEHDRHSHDVDVRHFAGETLAYVTPWNSHG